MKTICVPINLIAQDRLNFDQSKPGDLVELNKDAATFDTLWSKGFFKSINQLAGSNIDMFEDEIISGRMQLLNVLNSGLFNTDIYDANLKQVVYEINNLFEVAIKYGTGIYFYF